MFEMRNSQFSFTYLMDYTSDLVIFLDINGQMNLVNRSFEEFFNLSKDALIGRQFSELVSRLNLEGFNLKTFSNIEARLPISDLACTYRVNNQDEYVVWSLIPMINDKQVTDGFILMGKNKTETKKIEKESLQSKAIQEKLAMLNNIIKYAPDMIYWKDKDSIHLGCNDQFAIAAGYQDRSDVIGKSDHDFPWQSEAIKYNLDDKEVIESGRPRLNIEDVMPFKSGKQAIVITNKVPLRDSQGSIIGVLGIATDITHQKKVEQALSLAKEAAEAANRAKIEFIANMSHDIRTPLTGVVGMSKILEELVVDPKQKNYAGWLGESGDQLLKMLNEILEVVSADNLNESDLREEIFSVERMILDIVELEHPSTLVKGLDLISDVDEKIPPYLLSDHTKLHRILLNLLGNAIKFTNAGQVEIKVKLVAQTEQQVVLQFLVSDTGIGIPLDLQDKVFDRFFRVVPAYKGVYTGQGVGLHIAQTYAHLLGSKINFTSEPGIGTNFYFDLALEIADENVEEIGTALNPLVTSSSLPKTNPQDIPSDAPIFLLIEDNNIAILMLETLVSQAGYRFRSVFDGESALELVKNEDFDLIITDLGLPGISGIEFTSRLRKLEKKKNKTATPIIGLTAHADPKIKSECLDVGMNEAMTKPMSSAILDNIRLNYFSPIKKSSPPRGVEKGEAHTGRLGLDLPDNESELFELDSFAILDINKALSVIGNNKKLLKSILSSMVLHELPKDIHDIDSFHTEGDWSAIEKRAHRMKGGLVYCGADKLACACQYLERYKKAGRSENLESLYQQLYIVADETILAIKKWLSEEVTN
jgi:two-component system, OmpR family, aerobic respiration control sensor histidine kinase ArcB